MAYKDEYFPVKFDHIVAKTDKAILFSFDIDESKTLWIPLSIIDDTLDEDEKTFDVPMWFSKKQGWIQ